MSEPSQVIVVVEDDHHKMLVYRYLTRCGLRNYAIRFELSPSGAGSAESWVRQRFVKEGSIYRSRQARAATALIVVIDADTHSVRDRLGQLEQALKQAGKQVVSDGERIARLIPKRNIESWILCLNSQAVDEEIDYKRTRDDWKDLIPPAAETLNRWTLSNTEPPNNCSDSLRRGVSELRHLRF